MAEHDDKIRVHLSASRGFRSPGNVRYPGEYERVASSTADQPLPQLGRTRDRGVLVELLVVAAVPALVVVSFLFGRWSGETPTIVPAPKVYVVPADALATTTSSVGS